MSEREEVSKSPSLPSYGLYDTLNSSIPTRNLKKKELKRLTTETIPIEKQKAMLLLIIECAIRNDGYSPSSKKLPYKIKTTPQSTFNEGRVDIDVSKLPLEVQWVLYKFLDVGKE